MRQSRYNDSVFINCPFDAEYLPILQAIIFAVYQCGFYPRSALEEDNALNNRLGKIELCIEQCRYGIHDISRTELTNNHFPRFNMPFELGIFFGAKRFGDKKQKQKNALIFERVRFAYQQYISDLNGIDTKAHDNDPEKVIKTVRNWLFTASRRTTIPAHATILDKFRIFRAKLPEIAALLSFDIHEIPFNDYCIMVEEAIREDIEKSAT